MTAPIVQRLRDTTAAINPVAAEVCDTIDNDCNIATPDCSAAGIEFDAVSTIAHTVGTTTTLTVPHLVGSESNRLLLVLVGVEGNESVASLAYGSSPLDFLTAFGSGGATGSRMEIWSLLAPAPGTPDVAMTFTTAVDVAGVVVLSYSGVDPISPIDARVGAWAQGGPPTVDVTTSTSDAWIVGGVDVKGGDTTPFTPGLGITERYDFQSGTAVSADHSYAGGDMIAAVPGTYTFNFTPTVEDDWAMVAVEIRPAL